MIKIFTFKNDAGCHNSTVMHIRTLFAFLLALSFVPAESHDVSKTLPYGQICIHGPGYSELADLDSQVMKKVNTTLRVSCPSRLHIKRGLMASPTKCYAAMLFAVAVVDLLSWLVCKLDSRSTSLVSDRYFCLLSWSETKKARQFVGRMVLYSLGNGNFFHFIGKISSLAKITLWPILKIIFTFIRSQLLYHYLDWTSSRR